MAVLTLGFIWGGGVLEKANPVELKRDAERLERAGRLDQAIALYRQIVEQNPRDRDTINKIGDLYLKLNRARDAAEEYAKVADLYAKDGFLVRAIAMWMKVHMLNSAMLEPYLKLAELYAKQGLMMEAKSQYQIVVDEYLKRGKTKDAAEVLKKMAELDPGDLKVRSKLADIYTREGCSPKAVEEHIAIALELSKKGHLAEALQVLEKGLRIDPRSTRLREELARVQMVQKNHNPDAAHHLEDSEFIDEHLAEGRVFRRYGLVDRAIDQFEAVVARFPDHLEARQELLQAYKQKGLPAKADGQCGEPPQGGAEQRGMHAVGRSPECGTMQPALPVLGDTHERASDITISVAALNRDMSGRLGRPWVVLILLAGFAAIQAFRHGIHAVHVVTFVGALLSAGELLALWILILEERGRKRRGVLPMLIGFGGLLPWALGCYLVAYCGLWQLKGLLHGFSFALVLKSVAAIMAGYDIIAATDWILAVGRAIDTGRMTVTSSISEDGSVG